MRKVLSWENFLGESENQLTKEQIEFIESHITGMGKPEWSVNQKTGLIDLFPDFEVKDLKFKELPVQFGKIHGGFYIPDCGLESVVGLPISASDLDISENNLSSVRGFKFHVGGSIWFSKNPITSFIGLDPLSKCYTLYAYGCKLITLQGLDHKQFKSFNLGANPIPQNTLLKSLDWKADAYYSHIVENHSDAIFDLWNELDPEIQEEISKAHDSTVEDFYKWIKVSNRIY